jgi:hypothetical protein
MFLFLFSSILLPKRPTEREMPTEREAERESESQEKHRPVTQAVGPDPSTDDTGRAEDADGGA